MSAQTLAQIQQYEHRRFVPATAAHARPRVSAAQLARRRPRIADTQLEGWEISLFRLTSDTPCSPTPSGCKPFWVNRLVYVIAYRWFGPAPVHSLAAGGPPPFTGTEHWFGWELVGANSGQTLLAVANG